MGPGGQVRLITKVVMVMVMAMMVMMTDRDDVAFCGEVSAAITHERCSSSLL